jgi:tungstate transport system substrate-binding protein
MKFIKNPIMKIFLVTAVLVSLLGTLAGCNSTTATTTTKVITTTTTAYPILTPKVRFKIATTTSLYDTGLWAYLEPMFEKKANVELDIVYAGTGAAINQGKAGNVDVVIVHDPDQEKPFVADGWGINKRAFAYNFFMIAGPASDPAGIKGLDPVAAFKKIAEMGTKDATTVKFISRGDNSGTHGAEKRLWANAGLDYAKDIQKTSWYVEAGQGMGPTLTMANERNAYVLCDGSTFTSYKGKLALVSLVEKPSEATLNIYNAYAISTAKVKTANIKVANEFINWLISPEIQTVISQYGIKEFGGPLFNPISDGSCTYPPCPNLSENMKPVQ